MPEIQKTPKLLRENWEDYDEAKGITLEHNDVVFARLWSGLKESEYATANVENIDRLGNTIL